MADASTSATKVSPERFEEKFQEETRELLGYRFRVSFAVGIVLYLGFSALDWVFARDQWGVFLAMRAVAAGPGALYGWLDTKYNARPYYVRGW